MELTPSILDSNWSEIETKIKRFIMSFLPFLYGRIHK